MTERGSKICDGSHGKTLAVFGRSGGKEQSVDKIGDALIVDDLGANQIRIPFTTSPHFKAKKILRANQFKWSPNSKAWQSQRSYKALYLAQEIAKFDKKMKGESYGSHSQRESQRQW